MSLIVGVAKETAEGERRVAVTPKAVELLTRLGAEVWIEKGAGYESGFPDPEYDAKGVHWASSAAEIREKARVLLCVRAPEPQGLDERHAVIGFCDPLSEPHRAAAFADTGATLFSVELIPRITRAQSMDALSSMASIAGYKAVIFAAGALPRMFPLMMTAAGTIAAARALILGAGVAGLQAIATARRLGAVVMGYDVRPAVKEQIESLGAKFLQITIEGSGEGEGGYARQLTEAQIRSQREQMATALREMDVVITTAAVPGKKAPILLTKEMVRGWPPVRSWWTSPPSAAAIASSRNRERPSWIAASPSLGRSTYLRACPTTRARCMPATWWRFSRIWSRISSCTSIPTTKSCATHWSRKGKGGPSEGAGASRIGGECMSTEIELSIYVFILAGFLGLELVQRVSPLLHSPLMSLTNAVSAISVVGAILITGSGEATVLSKVLGVVAVTFSTINIVAGFLITDRMLKMFRKEGKKAK